MRFSGRIFRSGRFWAIEVPILGVYTQGQSRRDAFEMIADAIEILVDQEGFTVQVYPGMGDYFEVGSSDQSGLIALLLRRARHRSGLTLAEVAERLGAKSLNGYARYEQGRAVPTITKLTELYAAVTPRGDFVLCECRAE